jgi:hypothetical protein
MYALQQEEVLMKAQNGILSTHRRIREFEKLVHREKEESRQKIENGCQTEIVVSI